MDDLPPREAMLNWIDALWLATVPVDRTKDWLQRLEYRFSRRQIASLAEQIGLMSDEQFGRYLLDEAPPRVQWICLQAFRNLRQAIESPFAERDLLVAVSLQIADGDSLRTVVRQSLDTLARP